jgi:peptide/nickel transport system permease protein
MLFAIPAILLALIVVAALGAGWLNSAIAIGVGYIPSFVRVVRGPVLALREPMSNGRESRLPLLRQCRSRRR